VRLRDGCFLKHLLLVTQPNTASSAESIDSETAFQDLLERPMFHGLNKIAYALVFYRGYVLGTDATLLLTSIVPCIWLLVGRSE
jgi:hypothetical protein